MKKILLFLIIIGSTNLSYVKADTVLFSEAWPNSYISTGGVPLGLEGWGYGGWRHTYFTSAVNNIIGHANMHIAHDLEDLSLVMSYDALWVQIRDFHDVLSPIEVANIQAFALSGKRVVLMGENSQQWGDWDNSLLSVVGGSLGSDYLGDYMYPITGNKLTNNVNSIRTLHSATSLGGSTLFTENVITLWGHHQNVMTVFDNALVGNTGWNQADNEQFTNNALNWVKNSTVVPEPISSILFLVGGIFLAGRRFIKRES